MRTLIPVLLIGATIGLPAARLAAQDAMQKPEFVRAPDAIERVSWRTRTIVNDDRLTNWNFAVPSTGVAAPTFLDAVVRADAVVVDFIEGSSTQRVSAQIQKNLDASLTPAEIADLRARMGSVRLLSYRVASLPADADARRRVFAFAKAMGADTLVVPAATDLNGLDALADQHQITVAVLGDAAAAARTVKRSPAAAGGSALDSTRAPTALHSQQPATGSCTWSSAPRRSIRSSFASSTAATFGRS